MFSAREIAQAAKAPEAQIVAALGGREFVSQTEAVVIALSLPRFKTLFSIFSTGSFSSAVDGHDRGLRLALSSTAPLGFLAVALVVSMLDSVPSAATIPSNGHPAEVHLVFVAAPGPGGGGGGGLLQPMPAPKALLEGRRSSSSPAPPRERAVSIEPTPPDHQTPPPDVEPLPPVLAPVASAPADDRNRTGVLEESRADDASHGAGTNGGAGIGAGTGLGAGNGSGIGPGTGGGTGGGPYRPGSGIEPPRIVREVRPDYTEDARQRGLVGDVLLEVVVRRDGSVSDVKVLQGLGGGLDERAVHAVSQWRFAPATRQGVPVDVLVEVAVEFKLR